MEHILLYFLVITRLLLVNSNVTEFAALLSPATLLNLLISFNSLWIESLGFSVFEIFV